MDTIRTYLILFSVKIKEFLGKIYLVLSKIVYKIIRKLLANSEYVRWKIN